MQSLAEAYTCPSKGIGSPTRYRTPRDRAKEKETTSRLSPWRVLSRVDARSLAARCARLHVLARSLVRSLVLWLGSIDDRSADRSRAHTPRISPSRYAIKERQHHRSYRRNWTRRDKTGRGRERNGTERNEKEDRRLLRDGETDLPISGLSVWFRQTPLLAEPIEATEDIRGGLPGILRPRRAPLPPPLIRPELGKGDTHPSKKALRGVSFRHSRLPDPLHQLQSLNDLTASRFLRSTSYHSIHLSIHPFFDS